MIRLLKKDGVIVGAEEQVKDYLGDKHWLPIEILSLDEPKVECCQICESKKPTPPKRTLAEELRSTFQESDSTRLSIYTWEVVASKAKEVLLGEDKEENLILLLKRTKFETWEERAKKILKYLRETN